MTDPTPQPPEETLSLICHKHMTGGRAWYAVRDGWVEGYRAAANADRWIPVEERLPEEGIKVLAFASREMGYVIGPIVAEYTEGYWYECWELSYLDRVTHWRPLPEGPA